MKFSESQEEKILMEIKKHICPISVNNFINDRLKSIKPQSVTEFNDDLLVPKIPESVNKEKLLLLRDFIGKYEDFRIYKDDVAEIIKNADILFEDINCLIAVITHEPYLIEVINRIGNDQKIITNLRSHLSNVITGSILSDWDPISITKCL